MFEAGHVLPLRETATAGGTWSWYLAGWSSQTPLPSNRPLSPWSTNWTTWGPARTRRAGASRPHS